MPNGAEILLSAPFARQSSRLSHHLVYVVVVAILDAGADASGPLGPQAVADPALAEGRYARRGRPVRGIVGVQSDAKSTSSTSTA